MTKINDLPAGYKSGFIAVIGRPNVGKSTLLNRLLQQKIAIVSPRPQTTRLRQLGILTEDTYQIIFIDTPGIMKPRHKLDEFMLDEANDTLADADLILWLEDGSEPPGRAAPILARQLQNFAQKTILVINKGDLLTAEQVLPRTIAFRNLLPTISDWILLSASDGRGVDTLLNMLITALPEGPQYYPADQITETYMRDISAEMVREQLLLQLKDEIPHGTAVLVNEFKERENNTTYINATIYVDRQSHKRIVIGHKGSQLRRIGASARRQIEELIDGKVFLDLWVKVEPKWRRNKTLLKRFGYHKE